MRVRLVVAIEHLLRAEIINGKLDPTMTKRKMNVLGFPYTDDELKALEGLNEMDAIVAYLQKLGSDIPWREATATTIVGELKNPYSGVSPADMEPHISHE